MCLFCLSLNQSEPRKEFTNTGKHKHINNVTRELIANRRRRPTFRLLPNPKTETKKQTLSFCVSLLVVVFCFSVWSGSVLTSLSMKAPHTSSHDRATQKCKVTPYMPLNNWVHPSPHMVNSPCVDWYAGILCFIIVCFAFYVILEYIRLYQNTCFDTHDIILYCMTWLECFTILE